MNKTSRYPNLENVSVVNKVTTSSIRVLIVDDHELTRLGLKLTLQNQPGIELVGSATNGVEAVKMAEEVRPDVVVIDLQMPKLDGISASKQINAVWPQARLIIHTAVDDPQAEIFAQEARIDAIHHKARPSRELIDLVLELGSRNK